VKTLSTDIIDQVVQELVGLSHWVLKESGRPFGVEGLERAANVLLDQHEVCKDQYMVDYLIIAAMTTHDFARASSVLSGSEA